MEEYQQEQKGNAICTTGLIVINIGVFLILTLLGEENNPAFIREYGAMYGPYIIEKHEYYRFFSSMFLHFGIQHLMNNMVMLGALGYHLEPEIGAWRFLLIYVTTGIGGNLCSFLAEQSQGNAVVSAGASGAVFGLTGALLCALWKGQGTFGRLNKKKMLLFAALSVYLGLTSTGVDNVAHVGGLVCGILFGGLLIRRKESL